LAQQTHLRYNGDMIQGHRPRLWLALALVVVLVAAAALWLLGIQPDNGGRSALSTPATSAVSPLPTPTPASAATHPPPWAAGGAVLLWVALGIVLALGIAFVILRWHRHDVGYRSDTGHRHDTE
jgi:hypothetical protein